MNLICHVISENHVIKGSCDYMGSWPIKVIHYTTSLVAIGTLEVEIEC